MGLKKVILPVLGIDMESAVIERWLKSEGDSVARDEPIVLVETDKASTEILSPVEGVLRQILQLAGSTVPVTHTMALIEVEGPGDIGEGESGGLVTGRAGGLSPAAPRENSSLITHHPSLTQDPGLSTQDPAIHASPFTLHPSDAPLRASPAARRLAHELGVDLSQVRGTGPSGRIQGDDVRAFIQHSAPGTTIQHPTPNTQHPTQSSVLSTQSSLPGHLVPLSKKRRITAERMSLSARTVARLTMNTEIDASEMARLRTRLMPVYENESGVRLSYNDLLVKAVATALREHPYLNARWTDEGIFLVDQVNVGVAVAVDDGLVVPVVRDADRKKLAEISTELAGLVARAREDRLSLQDMAGGTFTITNLGMFGIDGFTPIVNPPEAAILGIGRIAEKPVGRNGEIVLRPMMGLSLSFDHRIVDGAPAARFLQRIQQLLEEPYLLI